jgi:type I restriction enzyme S subunit
MVGETTMSGKYTAYLEYKDYGEENWFDRLPSHWQIKRISYVAILKSGDSIVSEQIEVEGNYPVYGGNGLRGYNKEFNHDGSYILIGRQGALCGNINYGFGKFWASEHAVVVYPTLKMNFFWLGETLRAMDLNQYNVSAAQPGLAITNITCLKLPFPSFEEQQKIANFLDHETAKIDTLIAKQQQLITLLKEKRQAVISHAVTKGLNPNAPMRDSGVEWLGEVPLGWEVKRVRHTFEIDNNLRTPIDRQSRAEMAGDYRYYGPTGVLNRINRYNVEGEYFLLGEDGDHFLKFKDKAMTIHVEGQFNVNNHAHLIKGKDGCSTKWGCLFFEHKDLFPWLIKQGVGRYKLQKTVLLDIPVVVPSVTEQELILDYIKKKKLVFTKIESRAESLIAILKERRTALISAAVTGKIDVRNWQAPVTTNNHKEVAP